MKKFRYYLIICITLCCFTLILYYCKNYNPTSPSISKENSLTNASNTISNTTQSGSQTNINENTILTADEEHKFNILKNSFDKINSIISSILISDKNQQSLNKKKNINELTTSERQEHINEQRHIVNTQKMISKYQNFINWILKDKQKQKEIVNAFDSAYNLLENKRRIYATDKTLDQYVNDGIDCIFNNSCFNNKKYGYYINGNSYHNIIYIFFNDIFTNITVKDTNEQILRTLKENLTNEIVDSPLYILRNWQ